MEDSILFSRQLLGLKHTFETKSKNQITFFKEALKSQGTWNSCWLNSPYENCCSILSLTRASCTVSKSVVSFTNVLFLLACVCVPLLSIWYGMCVCCYNSGEAGELWFPCGCWRQCELSRDCGKASGATMTGRHGCREHRPQCRHGQGTRWKAILPCQPGGRQGCNGLTSQNAELPFIEGNLLLLPAVSILFLLENCTGRLCLCHEGRRFAVFGRCSPLWRRL